jgi:hypothetical protein
MRSNPLELSFSLHSKRLTESYYASLALVFKSVWRSFDSRHSTKYWVHNVLRATVTQILPGQLDDTVN